MSGGSKQQFKQFTINSIKDACLALGMLISGEVVNLEKYKEYATEAELLLEKTDGEYVPAKEYESVNDKLLFRQREILKLTADHQSSSFSYIDLRKHLEKNKYLSSLLSQEVIDLLSEFLDIRNWSFHNPQSLMVAAKEAAEKGVPKELIGMAHITPQINPVIIQRIDKYEMVMLASLVIHSKRRIEQFEKLLASMKADYQELFDSIEDKPYIMTAQGLSSEVQYLEVRTTASLSDHGSDIAQISMAIQKSKYDGSEEKFNEWIFRLRDATEEGTE